MFAKFVRKAKKFVWSALGWIYSFISKFKERFPRVFKFIVISLAILSFVAIIYVAVNYFKKLFENSKSQGNQPLCAQAIAVVSEAQGKCIVAGEVLDESTYTAAMGFLEKAKINSSDAEVVNFEKAQAALTKCYEAAKEGKTVQLNEFAMFFNETEGYSNGAIKLMRDYQNEMESARQEAARLLDVYEDAKAQGALQGNPEVQAKMAALNDKIANSKFFELKDQMEMYQRMGSKGKEEGLQYIDHFMKLKSADLQADLVDNFGGSLNRLRDALENNTDEDIQKAIDTIMDNMDSQEGGLTDAMQMIRNFNEIGRTDLAEPLMQQLRSAGRLK